MKYCPLCAAEYRDAISSCSGCGGARLVDSLRAIRASGNAGTLLWEGSDRQEFDSVVRALREAEIPAHVGGGVVGIFAKFVSPELRIHVLRANFQGALELVGSVSGNRERIWQTQACHTCLAECSAALAACPKCNAVLKVDHKKDASESLQESLPATITKYCPLCNAKFTDEHERCSVCGIDLVPEERRGQPLDERQRKEKILVVWRGGDPVAVSEVINLLRQAAIRHHVQPSNEHLVFELGMPRPKYAVRVFASDAAAAKELVANVRESSPFAPDIEDLEEGSAGPSRPKSPWIPAAATLEIWSGADAPLAELLEACFRENQIGVRREGAQPGSLRLLIMPADESQAREIIREVREATPSG
jgi:hypothetical protein